MDDDISRGGRIGMRPERSPETIIVGLISDTHGLVRPEIAKAFAGVQLILHAGDVGGSTVLARLATIAPVEAVYGNVATRTIRNCGPSALSRWGA